MQLKKTQRVTIEYRLKNLYEAGLDRRNKEFDEELAKDAELFDEEEDEDEFF